MKLNPTGETRNQCKAHDLELPHKESEVTGRIMSKLQSIILIKDYSQFF